MLDGRQGNPAVPWASPVNHPDVLVCVGDAVDVEETRRNQRARARLRCGRPLADQFHIEAALLLRFTQCRDFRIFVELDVPAEWQPFVEFAMMDQQYLAVMHDENRDREIDLFVKVGHLLLASVSGSIRVVNFTSCEKRPFRAKYRFVRISVPTVVIAGSLAFCAGGQACIWDSKTPWQEKREHPTLAQAILSTRAEMADIKELNERIQKLRASPRTNDPAWWNDLAGAYLRLGQAAEAVKLLEPLTNKFSTDYGVHANLGTAYHLLGRYAEAEREIRRDTEINPDAHFGLEKYHLAMLQYLSRDENYRSRHLYVDEFTYRFLTTPSHMRNPNKAEQAAYHEELTGLERKELQSELDKIRQQTTTEESASEFRRTLLRLAMADAPPSYFARWNLAEDPKLDDGVIYMAELNPKEPACWVMLGVVAVKHSDINLAKVAYQKAVKLGSPQADVLKWHLAHLNKYHPKYFGLPRELQLAVLAIALAIAYYIFRKWQDSSLRE